MAWAFSDVTYPSSMIDNSCDCSLFTCMGKLRNKKTTETATNILRSFLCADRDLLLPLTVLCSISLLAEKMFVCSNWYAFENVLVSLLIHSIAWTSDVFLLFCNVFTVALSQSLVIANSKREVITSIITMGTSDVSKESIQDIARTK